MVTFLQDQGKIAMVRSVLSCRRRLLPSTTFWGQVMAEESPTWAVLERAQVVLAILVVSHKEVF